MKRVRTCMQIGIVLTAVVLGSQLATAGQLNVVPVLQISGQYSDNVFFTDQDKQGDTFFLVNPGIALDYASTSVVASFAYQVGMQRFTDFDERDNTVHRLDMNVGFDLGSNFYVDVTDNLYITTDPLAFDASGDRLQRDSYTYNRFTPGFSYVFSGRGGRFAARYDRVDIDYDNLTDSEQNGFGLNASFKLGGLSSFGVDFFHFDRKFDEQNLEADVIDYKGNRFGVVVDRRVSPRLSWQFFGGYEERKFDQEAEERDYDSFIFEARGTGEIPEVFSWTLAVSQRLNDLAIRGAYKVRRLDFDLRKSVAEKLRLEFNGYIQNSENEQIAEEADYYGFRVEGQYLVAKFMNAWLGWEYIDRDSPDGSISSFQENRINFGLSLSYGL